ncbi:MAG: hypothetical protein R2697_17200 [Ilumatobacteraceae bacterium]
MTELAGAATVASAIAALVLDLAAVWSGEPGRSDVVGIAFVTDESSEVAWFAGALLL